MCAWLIQALSPSPPPLPSPWLHSVQQLYLPCPTNTIERVAPFTDRRCRSSTTTPPILRAVQSAEPTAFFRGSQDSEFANAPCKDTEHFTSFSARRCLNSTPSPPWCLVLWPGRRWTLWCCSGRTYCWWSVSTVLRLCICLFLQPFLCTSDPSQLGPANRPGLTCRWQT